MQAPNERGEGKVGSFLWLVGIVAVVWGGWNVAPVYIANYALADKVNQAARTPRGSMKDDQIAEMIMKDVRENNLDPYIQKSCFQIQTLETARRISCSYERTERVLPGINHTFHFTIAVDQPLIF